ncbi:MAG: IPExxxVDY family protein [Bacteroidetes bacterium]|nr:IPExxxVDY family protein [Bacteroidota bacterium]
MSGTRLSLNVAEMEDEFFEDSLLLGIACTTPVYRLCFQINQLLGFDFVRATKLDIELPTKGNKECILPVFQYAAPYNGPRYTLYQLKVANHRLLPELKTLDYLIMVQSSFPEEITYNLAQQIRQIPNIQLAKIINPFDLKKRNNLLV